MRRQAEARREAQKGQDHSTSPPRPSRHPAAVLVQTKEPGRASEHRATDRLTERASEKTEKRVHITGRKREREGWRGQRAEGTREVAQIYLPFCPAARDQH